MSGTLKRVVLCLIGSGATLCAFSSLAAGAPVGVKGGDIARCFFVLSRMWRRGEGDSIFSDIVSVVVAIAVSFAVLAILLGMLEKCFDSVSRLRRSGRLGEISGRLGRRIHMISGRFDCFIHMILDRLDHFIRLVWKRPVWVGFDVEQFLSKDETVIAQDVRIDQLRVTGGVLQGGWMQDQSIARAVRVVRSKTEMSFQLHALCPHCDRLVLKGVHVTLRETGKDIVARVDWAAYASAGHKYGYDLETLVKRNITNDEVRGAAPVATRADADGFGVSRLHFAVRSIKPILVGGKSGKQGIGIQTYGSGKCLCACQEGLGGAHVILAGRDCPPDFKRFAVVGNLDGTVSIMSKANGKYVSAEIRDDGRLVARADKIDSWEKFWLTRHPDGRCTLQSLISKKYVSVDPESGWVAAGADVANERTQLVIGKDEK